jgi:hypothetical protein
MPSRTHPEHGAIHRGGGLACGLTTGSRVLTLVGTTAYQCVRPIARALRRWNTGLVWTPLEVDSARVEASTKDRSLGLWIPLVP